MHHQYAGLDFLVASLTDHLLLPGLGAKGSPAATMPTGPESCRAVCFSSARTSRRPQHEKPAPSFCPQLRPTACLWTELHLGTFLTTKGLREAHDAALGTRSPSQGKEQRDVVLPDRSRSTAPALAPPALLSLGQVTRGVCFPKRPLRRRQPPSHLQNGDNAARFGIFSRPVFAKHSEPERCCLSTECWPQSLQAVFLKHFMPFHIKASYLQAQPTSAAG